MKIIQLSELVVGDVFCTEMKLKGRECFEVTHIDPSREKATVQSSLKDEPERISLSGKQVTWLRNKS